MKETSFIDININKTKLYENFINIKNIANFHILKCFNRLFSSRNIIKNINSYILILILLLHLIFIVIFYNKDLYVIINKIKDLIFGIKNIKLLDDKEKEENKIINNKKTKRRSKKRNKNKIYKNDSEIKQIKSIKLNERKNTNIEFINLKKHDNKNSFININNILNKTIYNNININKKNSRAINNKKDNIIDTANSILETKNKENINRVKIIMEYKEDEINGLEYEIAIQFDHRSYSQYYISLLRTKHNFIFSFFIVMIIIH